MIAKIIKNAKTKCWLDCGAAIPSHITRIGTITLENYQYLLKFKTPTLKSNNPRYVLKRNKCICTL